jgi:hypothetical protein
MECEIDHGYIRSVRDDAIELVRRSHEAVESASRIAGRAGSTSSTALLTGKKGALWRVSLVLFVECLFELRERLQEAIPPNADLAESLGACRTPMAIRGVSAASRSALANMLASNIVASIHDPLWPSDDDTASSVAVKSPDALTPTDASRIIKIAGDVAAAGNFLGSEAKSLIAEIDTETSLAVRLLDLTGWHRRKEGGPALPGDPPIHLLEKLHRAWVLGARVEGLTTKQCRVLRTLLDAYEEGRGLTGKMLRARSKCGDAVNILRSLATSNQSWEQVIQLPGGAYKGGYAVKWPETISKSTANP